MLRENTCSYFNIVGRVNGAVYMPSWWWMVIYSFVGISGPLKILAANWKKKKEKKRGWTKDTNEIKHALKVLPNKLQEMACPWLINTLWRTENHTPTMEALSYTNAFIQIVLSVSLSFIQCPEQRLDRLAETNFLGQ